MKKWVSTLVIVLLLPLASADARSGAVRVELNKLEPRDGGCRAYLLLKNGTDSAFETLKLDLAMFDPDGVVSRRLAVEAAPLPAGKTSLKVFDVDGLSCTDIGSVLLNDVAACADGSGARDDCLGLVSVGARGSVEFIK